MAASSELSMIFSSKDEEKSFIEEGNLAQLMENYQPSKFSQTADDKLPPKIVKGTRLTDVLIGRFVSHPGNVLARKIIFRNREWFRSLEDSDYKKTATDAMIGFFESKGTRFLEPIGKNNNSFRLAPYSNVFEKFRKSLRETGIRSDRKPPPKVSFPKRTCTKKPLADISKPETTHKTDTVSKPAPTKVKKKVKTAKPGVKKTKSPNTVPRRTTPLEQQRGAPAGASKIRVQPGDRLAIFWPDDDVYYPGTVVYATGTSVEFLYDDNEQETVDLSRDRFVKLGRTPVDPKLSFDQFKENKLQATSFETTLAAKPRRVSMPTATKSTKPTRDGFVHTSDSSNSSRSLTQEEKSAPIQMEGTFEQAQIAPVLSLADFLRRKMSSASA